MKNIFVDELKPGVKVEGKFAVKAKNLREFDGKPYISFELFDKSGKIDAVYWGDDAHFVSEKIGEDSIVQVYGLVQTYKGKNQIRVEKIAILNENEYDISDFIAVSKIPIDELWSSFLKVIENISDPALRALFGIILSDEAMVRSLKEAPGGKKWHHSYRG
ncbi:MAG: OB-fold nucleic acid binding domain-containing protein, partial [bacterium]